MSEPMTAQNTPKVSIGMPVYNGGKTLAKAIQSVIAQSVPEIEIIISDNGSKDNTAEVCKEFIAKDPRIRYFRQPETICATENFKFALDKARGPYFMWAAHDDVRDPDYAERLMEALEANPQAILAFGDVIRTENGVTAPMPLEFLNAGLSPLQRLRREALYPLHHLYGLWRTETLKRIPWRHVDWWHDTPIMMAATMMGDFLHVPGVRFHYLSNQHFFFHWKDSDGFGHKLAIVARRTYDLALLVWLCGWTVAKVSNPLLGLAGGWYGLRKVADQISSFIRQRI